MRKDYYVPDKYVLIPHNVNKNETHHKISQQNNMQGDLKEENKCPYCPGTKQIFNQLMLSFVIKDGILQRLYDYRAIERDDWTIRVFECKNPIVTTNPNHEYSDKPFYRKPLLDMI